MKAIKAKTQASKTPATPDLSASSRESMLADADMSILQAAECAARLDFDLDTFMRAAHSAYLQASPATREHLESVQLLAHLDDLRRRGILATA
jgi:hypothetical protein